MVKIVVNFTNNPHGVYYSGQNLSGEIEIENEKSRSIQCIKLKIEGFAECRWSESQGSGKTRRTVTYRGREDYLRTISYISGSDKGDKIELPAGVHKYNFECLLPANIPTSYESTHGQIRYHVKVAIERPWKLDIKTTFGFTVIRISDLNFIMPSLKFPAKGEISKTFFFGFGSNALFMSAEIPASGFVSGQQVPVSIKINNESSVDVENVKISLKQIVHYCSQTPRRKIKESIQTSIASPNPGVKSKNKGMIEGQIVIPPVVPTNIGTCSVVLIYYEIHVCAKVGGIHRSPVVKIPITIGTIPLFQSQYPQPMYPQISQPYQNPNLMQPQPSTSSNPNQFVNARVPTAPTPEDLPPPSYEIAMGMTAETSDDNQERVNDEVPFNPKYPVYHFTNQNQSSGSAPPSYGFSFNENSTQNEKK